MIDFTTEDSGEYFVDIIVKEDVNLTPKTLNFFIVSVADTIWESC